MGKPAYDRSQRIASLLRPHLSEWLRLRADLSSSLTISRVVVSDGLRAARIYIASWENDVDRRSILDKLNEAAPELRRRLGRQTALRGVPRLQFMYDEELDDARRLQRLISEANNR